MGASFVKKSTSAPAKEKTGMNRFFRFLGGLLAILIETVLLLVIALYGVMYVLAKGPSPTASELFVMSVKETSAMGFLADLFFSEEEIQEIMSAEGIEEYQDTDTSLIQIPSNSDASEEGSKADEWGYVDEDGDGIILVDVNGAGFSGYMMIVLDPSRVIMGSVPSSYGAVGYTVEDMALKFDAVAAVNAGGFYDPNGTGNGSIPDSLVVYDGKVYCAEYGTSSGFVGLDSNHILHVATNISAAEIEAKDIQYGVCFGPVLVANGEPCDVSSSGVNPRTAIGQRSDGAVLLLVIDGRQVISMGATYQDMVDIFLEFGAVNACNLDGGSSSLMWYEGEYVNNCASVIGIRPVPTTFVVLKEGANGNG